ncbi:MAG: alpha/beta fold hydrolase [Marinobacter sp.]|nr:alpha/beta fold hydrolase [Marinobacter sp.]
MINQWTEAGTSRFVTVRYDDKDYRVHFNDCDPKTGGEVVMMLHGSGPGATSWSNFNRNITPLTNVGFRVILMDVPGWGKSDPIICTSSRSDLNANFAKGLIDELGIKQVHPVGNSMGGHSAVAFALAHPQNVGKLILMGGGTSGVSSFTPMPAEGIRLVGKLYRDPSVENIRAMMETFVYDSSNLTDELFQARLKAMQANSEHLKNFVESQRLYPAQFSDYTPRLREIEAETLIIWGRDDRFVPLDFGLRLVAGIADSQLHVYNRCGHWAQWEHADRFNRMLLDFLAH